MWQYVTALYAGVLWDMCTRSAAQRRGTAKPHSELVRELLHSDIYPSTKMGILQADLGHSFIIAAKMVPGLHSFLERSSCFAGG